jgi:hypothetical protein
MTTSKLVYSVYYSVCFRCPERGRDVNQVPRRAGERHVILCGLNELGYQTLEEPGPHRVTGRPRIDDWL